MHREAFLLVLSPLPLYLNRIASFVSTQNHLHLLLKVLFKCCQLVRYFTLK